MRAGDVEIAILGGGAAGLSAALTLARARRSVVVVDSGEPRNAVAEGVHGLLGHEGLAPRDLVAGGRREVESFGAQVVQGRVASVQASKGGFVIETDDAVEIAARAVVVATGVQDQLPPIPGLAARWGRDVVHCPYCHGWEIRDRRIGLIATNPMSAMQALLFSQWSSDVQFFSQGVDFPDADLVKLAAVGVHVVDERVTEVLVVGDALTGVLVEGGRRIDVDVLAVPTRTIARLDGLEGLGLDVVETVTGLSVVVDAAGHTSRAGVWATGNITNGAQQVSEAAANATRVAMTLNTELVFDDADRALMTRSSAGARS